MNEEQLRIILEEYTAVSMWDIVYDITTILMLFVSLISLIVAWKVFKQSAQVHSESMILSKHIHADSLTPYIVIEEVKSVINLDVKGYPEIHVNKISIDDGRVLLNDNVKVELSNIKGKSIIELSIFNMTEVPAEIEIKYKFLGIESDSKEYLVGKGKRNISFRNEFNFDRESIIKIHESQILVQLSMIYKGPGMSARDTQSGQIRLNYSPEMDLILSELQNLSKKREYEKEE